MITIADTSCIRGNKVQFSWKLSGDCDQSGYRIVVKDKYNGTVWDSKKTDSPQRHNISCGITLPPGGRFHWTVSCYGADGSVDHACGPDIYTPLGEWKAKWVEPQRQRKPLSDNMQPHSKHDESVQAIDRLDPAVYMREVFVLAQAPSNAIVYITAHGIYGLWINGKPVADLLSPGYTSYDKRLEYQCYDVTGLLKDGQNTVGVVLADGWYTGKIGAAGIGWQYGEESALLMQIEYALPDQTTSTLCFDKGLKWNTGAWEYADLIVGEYYDAGKEPVGWLTSSYDDSEWMPVRIRDYGYDALALQTIPPVSVLRTIRPKIIRTPKGELVLDVGETIVGMISFRLRLKKGDIVSFEHSETLDAEGNFLQNIMGQNKQQTDFYRCGADGVWEWRPQFSFHGFRYVRITGTADCNPQHYLVHVIGTPMAQTGEFFCSDQRLNQLQENILRSQQGNMICIPTDCPQRERTGWTGDMQLYAPTACYEQDVEQFLRHWLQDMRNEQLPDGQMPHIIPYMPSHDQMKPPGLEETKVSAAGWSDAAVILPWRLYEAYGDAKILQENFSMMCRYMDSVESLAAELPAGSEQMSAERQGRQKYLWNTGFQFGDWLMPSVQMAGESIMEVAWETGCEVATLLYAITTDIMAKVCQVLGEDALAERYKTLNQNIREAFAAEYLNQDGTLAKDYQGIYVLAFAAGAIPDSLWEAAGNRLVQLIHDNNDCLDTGFLSVPYLLPVLHAIGQKSLANKLLFQDKCPSWLYEVKMGATTMWEYWNGYAEDGTPNNCSMNHFAFGCVGEYLYRTILGIEFMEPGYQRVRIEPDVLCGLSHAEGVFRSVWGNIEVAWEYTDGAAWIDVVVPPNVEAEIVLGDEQILRQCGRWHIKAKIEQKGYCDETGV